MIIGKYYSVMKHLFVVKISLLYMKTEPKTTTRLLFMHLLQLFAHHLLIVIWLLTWFWTKGENDLVYLCGVEMTGLCASYKTFWNIV